MLLRRCATRTWMPDLQWPKQCSRTCRQAQRKPPKQFFYQEANRYELLRLTRREFSLYSRQEALYCRELVLTYTVKKPLVDGLIDVLREVQTEVKSFHSMSLGNGPERETIRNNRNMCLFITCRKLTSY